MASVDSNRAETPLSESRSHGSYSSVSSLSKKSNKSTEKKRTMLENFQQQTFSSWQPIYTAKTVSPFLLLIGVIFIPIGAYLWVASDAILEIQIPYTDCLNTLSEVREDFNRSCADIINSTEASLEKNCKCLIAFSVPEELKGTVFVYYFLTNFFQNHRLYVSSRDNAQLNGDWGTVEEPRRPSRECAGYCYEGSDKCAGNEEGRIYLPCGAIANSMFSDTIKVFYKLPGNQTQVEVPLNRTGISWSTDKNYKFQNADWFQDTNYSDPEVQAKFVKPKSWRKSLWELDPDNPQNNGMKNEDFIVWMRVSALPSFRKLFRIMNRNDPERPEFEGGMPAGDYLLEIDYAFHVTSFGGTKSIIFTTASALGLPNRFLGLTYVIVGIVCIVLGVFLLAAYFHAGKRSPKVVHVD